MNVYVYLHADGKVYVDHARLLRGYVVDEARADVLRAACSLLPVVSDYLDSKMYYLTPEEFAAITGSPPCGL